MGGDADALVLPRGGFGGTTLTLWSPVARSDIAWNFEKFLIDGEGNMVQRYHRYFLVGDIEKDIDSLLEGHAHSRLVQPGRSPGVVWAACGEPRRTACRRKDRSPDRIRAGAAVDPRDGQSDD